MIQWLQGRSLKTRLQLFLVTFIVVVVALITAMCNYVFSHSFMEQLNEFNLNTVKNAVAQIDSSIQPYDQIIMQLFTDEEIRQMLAQDRSSYNSVLSLNRFTIKLSSVASQLRYKDILSVTIASPNNKYTYGRESMEFHREPYENKLYEKLRAANGKFSIIDSGLKEFSDNSAIPSFVCGRLIRDIQLNEVGYIVMFVRQSALGGALKDIHFGNDYTFTLTLDSGMPLYVDAQGSAMPKGTHASEPSSVVTAGGVDYALFTAESQQYGYTATKMVSLAVLTGGLGTIRNMTILLAVSFSLVALLLAISVSKSIARPVGVIQRTITDISKNDDLKKRIPPVKNREMDRLVDDLNGMLVRIDTLVKQNQQAHQEQVESELNMLMYQINPHFIYNTLNTIRWLAVINRQPQIKSVAENFSILIVNTMQDTGKLVSLLEEIRFAESYVEIMKVRYETFSFEVQIPEQLHQMRVPKFIFQPFIENSILHGLMGLDRRGQIWIRARREGGLLRLEVEDNGVGLEIRPEAPPQESGTRSLKIGLSNVHKRIQLRFGDTYGVQIGPAVEQGTLVTILLPAIEAEGV